MVTLEAELEKMLQQHKRSSQPASAGTSNERDPTLHSSDDTRLADLLNPGRTILTIGAL